MNEHDPVQWADLPLSQHHVKALVESGITPEIAQGRGYRTIDAEHLDDLGQLTPNGYGRTLRYAGLLVPSHGVTGGVVGHQLRPDAEVVNSRGDVRKYLSPYGEASVIDCPPAMLDQLRDQTVPIMITEGSKKADSAAARGLLCLALRGVDCWTAGSNTALEEWREFPMLGRQVAICYDSDITEKSGVRGAAKRLAKYLARQRGAVVSFILLPGKESGAKVGLDDWLVDNPDGDPWDLAVDRLPDIDEATDSDRQQILATDLDIADEWVARNSHAFRYLAEGQNWLGYREGIWDGEGGETYARVTVQQMVRTLQPYTIKYKDGEEKRVDATPWLRQSGRIQACLSQASANEEMVISAKLMNPNPYLFNLGNGTWDLRRGVLLAHDPDHLITLGSSIHQDPDAVAPLFEAFLEFVLPEPETRAFVQRIFGMAMIGDARDKEHVFPVFHGKGRNGKGTLMRLVQEVFGSYYTGISKGLLILRQYEEHSTVLASLFRKRLVTAQEVGEDDIWNVEQIKTLTGADDITGRYMREDEFTFTPSHTLIMAANNWPKVSAKEEAFWARVRKVPFVNTFAHGGDPNKEKALRTELPGILNWLIQGAQDYLANGLGEPAQVAAATASTRASADPIQNFLNEYVIVTHDSDDQIVFAELFERYEHWHRSTRERTKQTGRNNFGKEIARAAGIAPPREAGGKKISTFFGIRFSNGLGATDADSVDPFAGPDIDVDNPASDPADGASDPAGRPAPSEGSTVQDQAGSPAGSLGGVTLGSSHTPGPGNTGSPGSPGSLSEHVTKRSETRCNPESLNDSSTTKHLDSRRQEVSLKSHPGDPGDPAALMEPDRITWMADGAEQPSLFERPAVSYTRLPPADYTGTATETLPEGVLAFDIEGGSVERVHTAGPAFVKIFGYQTGDQLRVTEDVAEMVKLLRSAKTIVGHNIMSFDLMYFVINHGLDIHQLAADGKLIDTQLAEVLLNPPPFWMAPSRVPSNYKLDKLGEQKFGVGKSADLGSIVKRHGGNPKADFDKIPNDDAEYVTYCAADVDLTARIAKGQRRTPTQAAYMKREHRIAAIAAQTTMNGVKVDLDLLHERASAVERRKAELRERLMDQYGMPRVKKDGKTPAKGMTEEGRRAVERAFNDLGIELPRSASGKGPATGSEVMDGLMEQYADRPEVTELVETVKGFNGQRTVYGSALAALHPDGRVHPTINMYQATGRWSVSNPGMTVFGKREGKYIERDIFVADEGEVMISADLSQVDARAIAAWCQDPAYMAMFEPGVDLHAEVAFQMFGDRARRDDAKALSHGYNYGLGFNKLAQAHGEDLAQSFLDTMREKFPRLVAWKLEIKQEAIDNGCVLDNGWGRTLVINPDNVHTQAPAYVGQSAARDIMMEGLLRLPRWALPMLRVQVHDEIVLSVPEDRLDEVKAVVQDALSFPWRPFNGKRGHTQSVEIIGEAGKAAKTWGGVYAK